MSSNKNHKYQHNLFKTKKKTKNTDRSSTFMIFKCFFFNNTLLQVSKMLPHCITVPVSVVNFYLTQGCIKTVRTVGCSIR